MCMKIDADWTFVFAKKKLLDFDGVIGENGDDYGLGEMTGRLVDRAKELKRCQMLQLFWWWKMSLRFKD